MIGFMFAIYTATAAPSFPTRHAPNPNECRQTIGITAENKTQLVDASGVAVCSGVLLPLSEAAYLLDVREYAIALKAHTEAQQAQNAADLARVSVALRASRQQTIGAVAGGAIGIVAAFAAGSALAK